MAGWIPLSEMREREGLARPTAPADALCRLRPEHIGDRWDRLSSQPHSVAGLVPCRLVADQPEKRRQRLGVATVDGLGKLQDGMGLPAPIAPRDGSPWTRAAFWRRRSR